MVYCAVCLAHRILLLCIQEMRQPWPCRLPDCQVLVKLAQLHQELMACGHSTCHGGAACQTCRPTNFAVAIRSLFWQQVLLVRGAASCLDLHSSLAKVHVLYPLTVGGSHFQDIQWMTPRQQGMSFLRNSPPNGSGPDVPINSSLMLSP